MTIDSTQTFIEHNNRAIANQHAEYITGHALRRLLAEKVTQYAGSNPSVLDGAAGSGQLEQYINPSQFEAVDIQQASCEALRQNYLNASAHNTSYFNYVASGQMDCAVMNPPFSIKFKDLSQAEQINIRTLFPWKKSGVVDDIFILKSIKEVQRYGFYIAFPGLAYRKAETMLRVLIGENLAEIIMVENGFDDTPISVLLLIVDKHKQNTTVKNSIYDCKTQTERCSGTFELNEQYDWETAKDTIQKGKINIDDVNAQLDMQILKQLDAHMGVQLMLINTFNANIDFGGFVQNVHSICNRREREYYEHKQASGF